jgi:aryl-alcohol dehydrogenase-like predicted oxidoreductase
LAALGRPGYINLAHGDDLPQTRSVAALRTRTYDVLDEAYARGVRYVDAARSYGRAEEFLAGWLTGHDDVVLGSKWGYTYAADWRVDVLVHERKDHTVATFDRQLVETRALLGERLDAYQIHSVTPDSPALSDAALHRRLAELAETGVTVGLSVSGTAQAQAIRAALRVRVDGEPLFRSVQATWNLLEPAAGAALAEAHDAGCVVIVKEGLANGRLAHLDPVRDKDSAQWTVAAETGATPDAVALAAVLRQPWADIVLSGASTTAQLVSNLAAAAVELSESQVARLADLAETSERYWQTRAALPWN